MSVPIAFDEEGFADALVSQERSPQIAEEDDIYAPLLGVWEVLAVDRLEDGSRYESRGEWYFARTLEGRAIQDVWIAPKRPRAAPTPGLPNRYGTTMRMFDRDSGQWRVVWFNPVSGAFNTLMGWGENGQIIHEGVRDGQRIRWIFVEIGTDRFHWVGESEQADGVWVCEAEFFWRAPPVKEPFTRRSRSRDRASGRLCQLRRDVREDRHRFRRLVDTTAAGGVHGKVDEQEDILTVVLPAPEFIDRVRRGEITDLKTMVAGYWLAEYRSRLASSRLAG